MRRILPLFFMIAALVPPISAQSKAGTLLGTVRDEVKVLIPGVQITLTNIETKEIYKLKSNEMGGYKFDVPAGIYALTAELCGFNAVKLSDIKVSENESKRLDPMTLTVNTANTKSDCNVPRIGIPIPLAPVPNPPPTRL